ncbi:aminomethyl-transferring glycine dehydrogenase subunit GcvPA [Tissierella carlieri]|uniref:Probable glycine dehydrogenase (decarboxylating) subunit 1 n=1 Tax=Tissierella carlieri TaxID=689904 RepID=A0ABT1SH65_9FIRM|nr:aminomethyl-transferring glycine dehydrogenase subunit GcvPA [Tissierella carlieri]MBU5311826.1 aminomethyl-transferring glycine dehydrogenase subunit GcvPA [Tissierella carlieri]MCQ4925827.1 aminomethyl-transferring glycine dehydrogenase subunit GcvPA [Tissierella carlieri]MDU5082131.1 aminomethyl-transferring glycine dehydrogenase subunit GcvPA [Bacillota bacterium]
MFPYIPTTHQDEQEMLKSIGLNSLDDLFNDIPKDLQLNRELNLPKAKSELEVRSYLTELANKNCSTSKMTCFLGAGAYDHYIPSIINHIISRSEFYTSYTPYQPEISQGTLQYIFEFQTLICNLTGMDVANASLYDVGTAVAEAALMAAASARKDEIIISKTVRPESIQVLKTYAHVQGLKVIEVDMKDGVTDLEELDKLVNDNTAAVIVQSPNFFGIIEDLKAAGEIAHKAKKASFIASVDPISLAILKKPSELGVDVVVGEAQGMGIPVSFGGPYLGFIAAKSDYMRKLPGRIVGQTEDKNGKRSFVLTLTAREQHIRREKATSNICSNQGLNVLAATIYMVTLGKEGLKEVALQSTKKAHYAFEQITKSGKYKPLFDKPFFKEFAVTSDIDADKINADLIKENIIGGYHLGKDYPQFNNSVLYAVTEKRTKDEIDKLSSVLEGIK